MNRIVPISLALAAAVLAGCASTPESSNMVAQAEPKCKIAPADAAVVKKVPSELEQREAQAQLHSMPYFRQQQTKATPNALVDADRDCR